MTYVNENSFIATASLFIALGILAVGARLAVKRHRDNPYGWDDLLALPALV